MIQFSHAACAHIAYEEQRVWPDLRATLSPSEADQLGEKLARRQLTHLSAATGDC
jgi:hypothetical protein